jgi:glycosyltransferase involved in cell wall biosynthesis
MRLLVGLHHLELGGSQLNAVDLATTMRDRGHDVLLFAPREAGPGPVAELVARRGLRLVTAPTPRSRPSPAMAAALRRVVRRERIDLVHTYEAPLSMEAFFGAHLLDGVPLVFTLYAMTVPHWLPGSVPLVVGTRALAREARARCGGGVTLLEPPVDTAADDPAIVDGSAFRRQVGVADGERLLVIVSRLAADMKYPGIAETMDAIGLLGAAPVCLAVVGDGECFPTLRGHADAVNERLGRRAVVLTGALADPRPAYAAADVVLGMGGSALRGMAFGKPLVVLGEDGFWSPFTPATAERFLWQGFHGVGDGDRSAVPLAAHLRDLIADEPARRRLGDYGRRLVLERFSLHPAADALEARYREAATRRRPLPERAREAARVAAHLAASETLPPTLKQRLLRLRAAAYRPAPASQEQNP